MRFLYVGRLSREKSVTRLVDAFRLVLEQMPSARLSIVGDGPQAEELQSQAAGMNGYFTRPGDNKALDSQFGVDGTGRHTPFTGD